MFCKVHDMRPPLTDRQSEVLRFIAKSIASNGYPPTVREVGDKFGMSCTGANDHIKALVRKGWLSRAAGRARSLRILAAPEAA